MKLTSLLKRIENSIIKLSKNQLFSIRGKNIELRCLYGDLWITWPNGNERILKSGQSFQVSSKGKICIVALSNAFFQMSKRKWSAGTQSSREPSAIHEEADIFSIPL